MRNPRSVVITGASSGIGEALALDYAAPDVLLGLTGRNGQRLEAVGEACRRRGATVLAETADVTDAAALARFVERVAAERPLDLVIANAGIAASSGKPSAWAEQSRQVIATNVVGLINTIHPAVESMRRKPRPSGEPRGQIAILSSLASFRGIPGASAYSASKAAGRILGEALRGEMCGHGIEVSVICAGFVRSRITAGSRFPLPFLMDASRAARIIRRGLARNRGRIAFPWRLYFLAWLASALPISWTDPLFRRLSR